MRSYRLSSEEDRERIHKAIDGVPADGTQKVDIKKMGTRRSEAQNRLYWQWVGIIGSELGYRKDEMHQSLVQNLLSPEVKKINGKIVTIWPSTSSLKVGAFSAYLNDIDIFSADELGIILPKPGDYHDAMGGLSKSRPAVTEG